MIGFLKKINERKINIGDSNYIIKKDFVEDYEEFTDIYFHNDLDNRNIYLGSSYDKKKSMYSLIYDSEYIIFYKYSNNKIKILSIFNISSEKLINGTQSELLNYYDSIKNNHLRMRNSFIF